MIIKSSKSDESNRKRLESLKQKADEFKQMKKINKMNLSSSLDDQQTKQVAKSQSTSKKIIFDDDDDDNNEADQSKSIDYSQMTSFKLVPTDKLTSNGVRETNHVKKDITEEPAKPIAKKKFKLIDSDSDDDEQNEKDIELLESKINLNQKQADKLIYLKTKFSNNDKRFKIDDRFIDELGSDEDKKKKKEEEKDQNMQIKKKHKLERRKDENSDVDMKDDDENEESEEEDTSFDLKKEHLNSLKILEEITGKQLVKPVSDEKEKEKKKLSQKRMVRYDPTYDEHKVYELNDKDSTSEDEDNFKSKRNKTNKKDGESDNEAEETNQVPIQDSSQYYKVDENLKDLFSSKDVFKFQFLGEQPDEELNENHNDFEEQDKQDSNQFNVKTLSILEKFNRNKVMLSSDDDENETDDDEEEENNEIENPNVQAHKKTQMVESREEKRSWRNSQLNGTELDIFFPFNCDTGKKQIKEALDFFHRPNKTVDELREEWFKQRVLMVQEYKRKHKRVLRIKRTKQNEKMLPWRKKKS